MRRTRSPKNGKSSRGKPGPPSTCTDQVIQDAYRLCLLGCTNQQLAEWFGKDPTTIGHWYRNITRFRQAVDRGRMHADGKVAEALYKRAIGYTHRSVKFFKDRVTEREFDEDGNVISERSYTRIIKQPYLKHYPPDTKAASKFLAARNRETWGESYKVAHKHAHMHVGNMNIHSILSQLSDESEFSDDELQVIAKLGLSSQAKQITNGSHE